VFIKSLRSDDDAYHREAVEPERIEAHITYFASSKYKGADEPHKVGG